MKRLKVLVACCVVAACLTIGLAGCSSSGTYTPPEKTPTLTAPTIVDSGTLRVGMNTNSAPFAGQPSGSTKVVGINVDIAAALADSFGLKLEIVDVGTDPESALTSGKVDVVLGVSKSSDTATTFWKSDIYLQTAVALFANSANATVPTTASAPKIAAQVSSTSSWAVTNEFGVDALTSTTDLQSAFSALTSGQVGYVAADAIIGAYAARNASDDVSIVALMQQPSGYCVGVLDSNTALKQAVSDAVATLSGNGIVSVIEAKWLGEALDIDSIPLTAGATSATTNSSTTTQGTGAATAATGTTTTTTTGNATAA